jgi:hypothetical protein
VLVAVESADDAEEANETGALVADILAPDFVDEG